MIDSGDEAERILKVIEQHKLTLKYIILTHGHLDHVSASSTIHQKTGAEILMHQADQVLLDNLSIQATMFGLDTPETPTIDRYIYEGDQIQFGEHALSVIETPGHSPGGICLQLYGKEKMLFVGDTLFAGSIGRTDLWGASHQQLLSSIREKLCPLDDDMVVHTGHGPSTTLRDEKRWNPFF